MTAPALRNPIILGFNPDPSIIRVGSDYFLATSTFEFFPGIPIYHSTNLVDWKRIGHVLTRPSQLNLRTVESSGGVYAPCLRYHKGRFYVAVGAQHRRSFGLPIRHIVEMQGFHVYTDDILDESSWSDPVHYDVTGIDQDLFWDDDDTCYLSYSKTRHSPHFHMKVYTVPIDVETGDMLSTTKLAMAADTSITANDICEGPHIFKKDGTYYLITANGGTEEGHSEWVYRSAEGPMGPWTPGPTAALGAAEAAAQDRRPAVNPMIYNANHPEVQNTGHMDLVEGPDGRWWAVFLGVRPRWDKDDAERETPLQSQLGRETFIAPVEWHDGWPVVNCGRPISINAHADVSELARLPRISAEWREEWKFTPDTNLSLEGWYHLRTPSKTRHSLARRPSYLALRGGPYGLEHDEAVTMLLQKQTAFDGVFAVSMELELDAAHGRVHQTGGEDGNGAVMVGDEAGVVVWWSKWAQAALCVRSVEDGKRELVFRRPKEDDVTFEETSQALPSTWSGSLTFRIECSRSGYTLIAALPPSTPSPPDRRCGEGVDSTSRRGECIGAESGDGGAGVQIASHFVPVHLITRPSPRTSYFIGTHLGVYATGAEGVAARRWAYFSEASWAGVREGGA